MSKSKKAVKFCKPCDNCRRPTSEGAITGWGFLCGDCIYMKDFLMRQMKAALEAFGIILGRNGRKVKL